MLHRQFLCQFTIIRKAFHLNESEDDLDKLQLIIDMTKILEDIDCSLEDLGVFYKIMQNKCEH